MYFAVKLATYILFISTFDSSSTFPILSRVRQDAIVETMKFGENGLDNLLRIRRQNPVVQPIWTSDQGFGDIFLDYDVKVTDRKLEETEAIRQLIHHVVRNGTFAVELDKGDFEEDSKDSETVSEPEVAPELDATTAELKPASQPKHKQEARSSTSSKSSKKSEKGIKVNSVGSMFSAWLKKIWVNLWGKN